jgi:hypothetical protein
VTVTANRRSTLKKIEGLERMRNSTNGNPRYKVTFTDGDSCTTKPDAAVAHGLANPEYQCWLVCTFEEHQLVYARPAISPDIHSPFGDMRDVRAASARGDRADWFDPAAMEHFGTVIETDLIRGRLFVTSDQWRPTDWGRRHGALRDSERRFTLRYAMDDGAIETVGRFQQYATIGEAVVAALEFDT